MTTMKTRNILIALLGTTMMLASCDSYLDKLPDDRAEVNTEEKVAKLLTNCYPQSSNVLMMELSSDNVLDNGTQYSNFPGVEEIYRFKEVTSTFNDDPRSFWNNAYRAVASANEALSSIDAMSEDMTPTLAGMRSEALLCRAFGMFMLSNVFCMAYDPQKANEYLGLPYPLEPEQDPNAKYERGTLEELYANIANDIEAAMPTLNDSYMSIPKYHFNTKAAYAFAARFYLYYHKYDKVIEYATKALGSSPANYLRDYSKYKDLAGSQDIFNAYIQSGENANFMLLPAYSMAARVFEGSYLRFVHNEEVLGFETYWARCPWAASNATSGNNLLWMAHTLYGNNLITMFPKMFESFEYTDKVNGTGYSHVVDTYFTGDETLLCRAEAYALRNKEGDLQKAMDDMNTWCSTNLEESYGSMTRRTYTIEQIDAFMQNTHYSPVVPEDKALRSIKKTLHPQGFTVNAGQQESLIQLVLHMRRLTTQSQGTRFMDLKRYGIEYAHFVDKEEPIVFTAGDLRGALQLPNDVITAGLEANPR